MTGSVRRVSYVSDTTDDDSSKIGVGALVSVPQLGGFVERSSEGCESSLIMMAASVGAGDWAADAQAFAAWRPVVSATAGPEDDFVLPGFMPYADKVDIMAVLCCVAKGGHSGARFARILHRAEIRSDVAASVSEHGLELIAAQMGYEDAVKRIERKLELDGTSFASDVASLALVNAICSSSGRRAATAGSVPSIVANTVKVAVIGGHYAVTAADASASKAMKSIRDLSPDMVLLPDVMQRALLSVPVHVSGACAATSLVRRSDGVFVTTSAYDASNAYQVDSLPQGVCVLPGSYDMVVPTSVLGDYLRAVVITPRLMREPGYCYLRTVHPGVRWQAYRGMGVEPNGGVLRAMIPTCMDWSGAGEAKCHVVKIAPDGRRYYHCSTEGNLPSMIRDVDVIGSTADKLQGDVERMLADLVAGKAGPKAPAAAAMRSGPARAVGVPPPPPPPQLGRQAAVRQPRVLPEAVRYDSDEGSESTASSSFVATTGRFKDGLPSMKRPVNYASSASTMSTRSFAAVQRAQPAMFQSSSSVRAFGILEGPAAAYDPAWTPVSDPGVREWRKRFSSGSPVGYDVLSEVFKCDRRGLPRLPLGSGVSVFIPPAITSATVGDPLNFKDVSCPVDTWFAARCKVRKATNAAPVSFVLAPETEGVLTRYELDSKGAVSVCGRVTFGAGAHVLWVISPVSVSVTGPVQVVKLWSNEGAEGLGQQMLAFAFTFVAVAVRCHSRGVVADRVAGLKLVAEDSNAGLVRYRKTIACKSGGSVYCYLNDDAEDEPALVEAKHVGLQHIVANGVRVAAIDNNASRVVLASNQVSMSFHARAMAVNDKVVVTATCARSVAFADLVVKSGVTGLLKAPPAGLLASNVL